MTEEDNGIAEATDVLLYSLLDKDQKIPSKCLATSDFDNDDSVRTYKLTIGDVEKWRIKTCTGAIEELWFSKPGSIRKVFISFKVKRVSEIDNIRETYRMRFHIYCNWLATKHEYLSHCIARKAAENGDTEQLYPRLEFRNAIEEQLCTWQEFPELGRFRMQTFSDFAKNKTDKIAEDQFDCSHARFIRAKLECEMTFAEELELQAFPFDCQDLSCIIYERTIGDTRCVFLPELRSPNFGSIDLRYSVIDQWDLETAMLEIGGVDCTHTDCDITHTIIVLRLKIKRRWKVFFWNIQFLVACICGLALTAFSLVGPDNLGNRLNLVITLILTAVTFTFAVLEKLPNVAYLTYMKTKQIMNGQDKYILISYGYLVALMVESTVVNSMNDKIDIYFFYVFLSFLIIYHIAFLWYAKQLRSQEEQKLLLNSEEVEHGINHLRPSLYFDYTEREQVQAKRTKHVYTLSIGKGKNGRLLAFNGRMVIPNGMNNDLKNQVKHNQEKLERLHKARSMYWLNTAAEQKEQKQATKSLQMLFSNKTSPFIQKKTNQIAQECTFQHECVKNVQNMNYRQRASARRRKRGVEEAKSTYLYLKGSKNVIRLYKLFILNILGNSINFFFFCPLELLR
ncbi:nicotinic acetylcholine receptor alpha 9b subunit [Reticulomyxa filosa]|uniref:Nicotinic acetylcholine receptor alpha 9b subunit n=1 Tax=Reticulomyxa filosa TaxID=46433 RepID=X6M6Y0_RETFI|nr:nicotinic acetylcholine receptor alpha 9b subunit [Reticulomyxa filosa]|eukprot:ETO09753.1 nicotinic acetylcholine receptor alpha 9b subunit [Reticulomyxa filosa]